jgi:hypothetical protein
MTTNEAKEALLLYRGSIDDADPKIQEALAYARRDPELAAWMREQRSSYDAIRSKFREVEPPSDLAERIIRQRPIPFRRPWAQVLKLAAAIVISAGVTALAMSLWQRGTHQVVQGQETVVKRPPVQGQEIVVKGEVLDMTCYIAHNFSGPQHAECAKTCIRKGLPVGLKGEDGKVYLLVGDKQPVNAELADYAAKTVTIRGIETKRRGFALLQVKEIRKF